MLLVTHIRMDGPARFYENITDVCCEEIDGARERDAAAAPKAMSVVHLIAAIKQGTQVFTKGQPPAAVEIFVVYDREYIRSKLGATAQNDLLSLPTF